MSRDDPRAQILPYRYDLYGVTNHFGTLSSRHCECLFRLNVYAYLARPTDTMFVSSRGGWLYCDDSRVTSADAKDVVVRFFLSALSAQECSRDPNVCVFASGQASVHSVLQEDQSVARAHLRPIYLPLLVYLLSGVFSPVHLH